MTHRRRLAFRQSALRWHPDKFEARFRSRIAAVTRAEPAPVATGGPPAPPPDWEAISARAHEISQAINDQWDKIRGAR